MYKLVVSEKVLKQLKKIDKPIAKLILIWLEKNVDNCENPRIHGKALKGNLNEYWRYRVGDYRILCLINDNELVVLAISIGHRKDIYEK